MDMEWIVKLVLECWSLENMILEVDQSLVEPVISVALLRLAVSDILDIQRVQAMGAQWVLEWSGKALCKNWVVILALKNEI